MDRLDQNEEAPEWFKGKYLGMIYCWVFGSATLIAWNGILTIGDYYYNIFPDFFPERELVVFYMLPAVGSMTLLAYFESRIDTRKRNLAGLIILLLSTPLLLIIDLEASGKGGVKPYVCILAITSFMGIAEALFQGGIVGDLSFMCSEFLQSYIAGIAGSGVLASFMRLFTIAMFNKNSKDLRMGFILFFAISASFQLLCVVLYAIFFPKLPIVKFYRWKAFSEGSKTVQSDLAASGIDRHEMNQVVANERLSTKKLFLLNIDYAIDIFLIFVLSISIFPGFLYEYTGSPQLASEYAIILVTVYNVSDLVARCCAAVECLKLKSRKILMVVVFSRFLLVPAFYFTANKSGNQVWVILFTSVLGFSCGYLYSCVISEAPKGYKGPEQNALGNIFILCTLSGLTTGTFLDWLWLIATKQAV